MTQRPSAAWFCERPPEKRPIVWRGWCRWRGGWRGRRKRGPRARALLLVACGLDQTLQANWGIAVLIGSRLTNHAESDEATPPCHAQETRWEMRRRGCEPVRGAAKAGGCTE